MQAFRRCLSSSLAAAFVFSCSVRAFAPATGRLSHARPCLSWKVLPWKAPARPTNPFAIQGGTGRIHKHRAPPSFARAAAASSNTIGWRTVFLWEYAGPLFLFPAGVAVAGADLTAPHAATALALWTMHFAKRLLETLFVHSFSKATMPLANLFKNCAYYWSFSLLIAADVALGIPRTTPRMPFVALFLVAEALNAYCHLHLASLRRTAGTKQHVIPTAWPFRLCSSPNYTFEILSWIAFSAALRSRAGFLFTVVGAAQMAVWARQKLRRYQRKFKDSPEFTVTSALIPGVF